MFQREGVEKIKTHVYVLSLIHPPPPPKEVIHLGYNVQKLVGPERLQMTV
jgi:hypothetical protein